MGLRNIWQHYKSTGPLRITGRAFGRLRRFRRGLNPALPESPQALGKRGEDLAALYLKKQGAKVLYRNFTPPKGGEIDLVAREKKVLLFCEVKTRRAETMRGRPMEAVDRSKQALIERGGRAYVRLLGREVPIRYDILEVVVQAEAPPQIRWIKNAF